MENKMPLTLADQLAIRELYAVYNLASDATESERYADCFTPDGAMLSPEVGIVVRGRAALIAHKERDKANRKGQYRRHWNANLHLEPQPDGSVRGQCYLLAYQGNPGELPRLADCGVYEDRLVRDASGAWKFAERRLTMDGSTWGQAAAEEEKAT